MKSHFRYRSAFFGVAAFTLFACDGNSTGSRPEDLGPVAYMSLATPTDEWSILLADPDGGEPRLFTQDAGAEAFPAWSADREQLAYYVEGAGIIYVVHKDGTNRRQVVQLTGVTSIAWSPDGRRLAIDRNYPIFDGPTGIWLVNVDGTGLTHLVPSPASAPDWSPDGSRIAFEIYDVFTNLQTDPRGIDVINVDGSNRRTIVPAPDGAWVREPAWSPDGRSLAYARGDMDTTFLYIAGADGENPRKITSTGSAGGYQLDLGPAWSRDGQWLAFGRQYPECTGTAACVHRREIFVMRRNGTGETRITDTPHYTNGHPTW
jgi:Tol biopolymer transport system component